MSNVVNLDSYRISKIRTKSDYNEGLDILDKQINLLYKKSVLSYKSYKELKARLKDIVKGDE
jgi:hypothetical protein|tara:strand:- start:450 stop:635 length:186 start_codon:yes stop_codon:yes gene_type:complete